MSKFFFGSKSSFILKEINKDLKAVAERALELTPIDFAIIEGFRDIDTQREYYKRGKSLIMESAHLIGAAIDIVGLPNNKSDFSKETYQPIIEAFKKASNELDIPIDCGYDWGDEEDEYSFRDMPHIELDRKHYKELYKSLEQLDLDNE